MQDQRSRLQNFLHSPSFFIIAGVSIVVLIVATVLLLSNKSPKYSEDDAEYYEISSIPVTNFTDFFPDFDEAYQQGLETAIYSQAYRDGNPNITTTATIRTDSLHTVDYKDYYTAYDFIVDIKDLELSYLVAFQYGRLGAVVTSVDYAFSIFCPEEDQQIYDHLYCTANTGYVRPTEASIAENEKNMIIDNE